MDDELIVTPGANQVVVVKVDPQTHDVLEEGDDVAVRPKRTYADLYSEVDQ